MSWLDALRHRAAVLIRGESYLRERDAELDTHLALESMHQEHDGAPPPDAHAAARRKLGNVTNVREDTRRAAGFGFADRLRQDITYALRGLRRSPGFTAMVVVTLALGVGANAAMFSFLDRVFMRDPAGVAEPGNVHRLYFWTPRVVSARGDTSAYAFFNYPRFAAIRDGAGDAAQFALYTPPSNVTVRRGEASDLAWVSYASHEYFTLLGVPIALGRNFGPDESRIESPAPVAIVSHAYWQRAFGGDSAIIGQTISISRQLFTIVGVTAEGFAGIDLSVAEVFPSVTSYPGQGQLGLPWYQWTGNYFKAIARVAGPGGDAQLEARATGIVRHADLSSSRPDSLIRVLAGPIVEARGPARDAQEISIATRLAGVAAIILLIACANVATLLLIRATRRHREIAVRLALGVSRGRLAMQIATETLVLAAFATVGALLVAHWGGTALRSVLLPTTAWTGSVLDLRVALLGSAVAVVIALAAAIAPILRAVRVDVQDALKSGAREGTYRRSRLQASLLVVQAGLSVILLVGAGLFVRSLDKVQGIRVGFDVNQLLFVRVTGDDAPPPAVRGTAFRELAARVSDVPGVNGVALAVHAPMGGNTVMRLYTPGRDSTIPAYQNRVSPRFFAVTGMRIIEGRAFTDADAADSGTAVVVTAEMKKQFWPNESPVGKCLMLGVREAPCSRIVGVAENPRQRSVIETKTEPYYFPALPANAVASFGVVVIRLQPQHTAAVRARVEQELRQLLPSAGTVRIERMTERLAPQYRPWKLGAQLFSAMSILALIVAAIGVYSATMYAVSQRSHEMGVRIALGAQMRDVMRLVVREGFTVVAIGIVFGVGVALMLGKLLTSLLYGVTPRDPAVIIAASLVLALVGVVACLVPAWRAGRADPVKALRAD